MIAKTDKNTALIREAIEACGWEYLDTHTVSNGFPDCIAIRKAHYHKYWTGGFFTEFIEIKSATGKLTPAEQKFHDAHPGLVQIVRSAEDVIELLNR